MQQSPFVFIIEAIRLPFDENKRRLFFYQASLHKTVDAEVLSLCKIAAACLKLRQSGNRMEVLDLSSVVTGAGMVDT
ncbi:MAG: hypothetical protein IJ461_09625, partial [Clostridia bacterium]|nr:hypothetical protein [Clostridia bacterium]